MEWEFIEDFFEWHADSVIHDQMSPFVWRIKVCQDGKFDVNGSDSELCNGVSAFETLSSAKAFCESSELADAASIKGDSVSIPIIGDCEFAGNRYKIRTIRDLYDIPEAKLKDCLADIAEGIELHKTAANLTDVECHPLDEILWVDDGKNDLAIRIQQG